MRLGGFYTANSVAELEPLCEKLDAHGLSAIQMPAGFEEWSDEECFQYGEEARRLGIHVGEAGFWENIIEPDEAAFRERIHKVRRMLKKADLVGVRCVVTLVGSLQEGSALSVCPENFSLRAKERFREFCLRIVDGMDLQVTRYGTEPWVNGFYYQPEEIRDFLDWVDHPYIGLHLDQMNMITQQSYFESTALIRKTFRLLRDRIHSVHAKDYLWNHEFPSFVRIEETFVGEGLMDYDSYLDELNALDADMTVFTEHWKTEEEYRKAIVCLHDAATRANLRFLRRGEPLLMAGAAAPVAVA